MTDPIECHVTKSKLKYKWVVVDPPLAEKWLATRNLNNRFIRKAKIRNQAQDMIEGRWCDNGEGMKFAPDGELLDGVHRCLAIVQYNLRIPMRIIVDVPKLAMPTIDTGTSRSFADYLRMAGEKEVVVQSGITRRYVLWNRGLKEVSKIRGGITPTLSQLREIYESHQNEIRFSGKIGGDIHYRTQFLGKTDGGLFFMLTAEIDYDQAMEFKDRLIDGANLSELNPISALRRRLLSYGANNLTKPERLALFINAWNLWRQDKTADGGIYLVYNDEGGRSSVPLTNTNYPVPQ